MQHAFMSVRATVRDRKGLRKFAWWGFNLWVPPYLSLSAVHGDMGFSARTMTVIIVTMQVGMWLGYVSFGYLATAWGRKRVYVSFLLYATALLTLFCGSAIALAAPGARAMPCLRGDRLFQRLRCAYG